MTYVELSKKLNSFFNKNYIKSYDFIDYDYINRSKDKLFMLTENMLIIDGWCLKNDISYDFDNNTKKYLYYFLKFLKKEFNLTNELNDKIFKYDDKGVYCTVKNNKIKCYSK